MKKLLFLVFALALVPVFVPAKADALTLRERVSRLEAKMSCMRKVPLLEFGDLTWYGNPSTGPNAATVYDTTSPTSTPDQDNPDSLTDLGAVFAVDLNYGYPAGTRTDVWALGIVNSRTCRRRFNSLPNPFAARTGYQRVVSAKLARLQ